MTEIVQLEHTTREFLIGDITTTNDPTTDIVEFSITPDTAADPSATWVPGTWSGAWNGTTGTVAVITPLVGLGQPLALAQSTDYKVWVRWTVGVEQPVDVIGRIKAT